MPRVKAIAESLPASENPRHAQSKLYQQPGGGSVRLTWSPVNQTWFLLWPGESPAEQQQVLSRFDTWEEGDREARRIVEAPAENPRRGRIGPSGITPTARVTLIPGHIYAMGASSSPELIEIISVTEDRITYRKAKYGNQSQVIERWIGEDLIAQGERTFLQRYGVTPQVWEHMSEAERGEVVRSKMGLRDGGAAENPLEVGRGTYTQHLRLHHYTGSLRVTDLQNAGKRGKKVKELTLAPKTMNDAQAGEIISRVADVIVQQDMDYAQAVAYLESGGENEYRLEERNLRGIDVEPAGVTINLEKKHDDGTIVTLHASPHEFRATNSVVMHAPGKAADGFRQDTLYYSRDRGGGIVFYAWLKANAAKASEMTIRQLTKVWDSLGSKYDSH